MQDLSPSDIHHVHGGLAVPRIGVRDAAGTGIDRRSVPWHGVDPAWHPWLRLAPAVDPGR